MNNDHPVHESVTAPPLHLDEHRRRMWRGVRVAVATALILLLAAGWIAYARSHQPPPPPRLETVRAERGDIEQGVNAVGNVIMLNYVDVGAKVTGQISDVFVGIGDVVKEGKLLVAISPVIPTSRIESNRAQLARLKAELAGQNAQLDFAQLQFQRQSQLKAENATREETYESTRMGMYSAQAKVDAINAQIQQLEVAMKEDEAIQKETKVQAPMSGTVVALSARVGQTLSANQDVLMRIADLSRMSVQARVAEEDVTRLRKGMLVYFTTPGYPGKQWLGKLRQIMPLPTEDSGKQGKKAYYTVLFDVSNPGRELMAGMTADVFFVLERVEHAITIPAALVVKPDRKGMQLLQVMQPDGKLQIRSVRIGINNGERAQVLSGLTEGEQVVVPNGSALR